MTETNTIGLNTEQLDLVVRGLRFLRSSILLEPRFPSDDVRADRETKLQEVESLIEHFSSREKAVHA
ncbi:hypothetical protein [Thalassoroseus pseudoceratinae]|uniref:hypothetical protein n=1 Tax=Thalassoroseus pseudoceratinae TaxID=2713176 RepID=UPI001421F99A|nr:hypothetical protein [Thalassoroseus pseudoceratinae]